MAANPFDDTGEVSSTTNRAGVLRGFDLQKSTQPQQPDPLTQTRVAQEQAMLANGEAEIMTPQDLKDAAQRARVEGEQLTAQIGETSRKAAQEGRETSEATAGWAADVAAWNERQEAARAANATTPPPQLTTAELLALANHPDEAYRLLAETQGLTAPPSASPAGSNTQAPAAPDAPPPAAEAGSASQQSAGASRTVTVNSGDSLWSIASDALSANGQEPTQPQIERYTAKLAAANGIEITSDGMAVIQPRQTLQLPGQPEPQVAASPKPQPSPPAAAAQPESTPDSPASPAQDAAQAKTGPSLRDRAQDVMQAFGLGGAFAMMEELATTIGDFTRHTANNLARGEQGREESVAALGAMARPAVPDARGMTGERGVA